LGLLITRDRRNYVTKAQAQTLGLAYVSGSNFILRPDSSTTLSASGAGRNSFRLVSNNEYTTHVAVFVFGPSHHLVLIRIPTLTVLTFNTCHRAVGQSTLSI
jgi:hypothetical protein